jgi:hypothetical protein
MVSSSRSGRRGQAHTLEALIAALLLIASIGFALQMTAVTPLSASTSSQHLENQLKATSEGVLASTAETGALKDAVLYWNETTGQFHNVSDRGYYTNDPPSNAFGDALERTLDERNVAYNVYILYHKSDGTVERRPLIRRGEPSDHAVKASRTVVLTDTDRLVSNSGNHTGVTVTGSPSYFAPDTAVSSGGVYNYLRVEVVAWRI